MRRTCGESDLEFLSNYEDEAVKTAYVIFDRSSWDHFIVVLAKNEWEAWAKVNQNPQLVDLYGTISLGKDGEGWDLIEAKMIS